MGDRTLARLLAIGVGGLILSLSPDRGRALRPGRVRRPCSQIRCRCSVNVLELPAANDA